jgi:glycine betaine/proline transport system permease protein
VAVQAPSRVPVAGADQRLSGAVVHTPPNPWRRRIAWAAGTAVVLLIGLQLTAGYPERWVLDVQGRFVAIEDWIIQNQRSHWLFTSILTPITDGLRAALDGVVDILSRMTWLGLTIGAAALSGIVAGWRMAVLAGAAVLTMGVLGVWDEGIETLALVLVSVVIALLLGVPLGVWAGRRPRAERVLRPILDGMQTIPAFSYLLPCVLFFGIGGPPALIATVIFALPPAVRLTALGIRGVPSGTMEVSDAYGATKRQTMRKVQLPLAKPSMMLGVNQTIMMALGMVVIASVVGAGGLGQAVYDGLSRLNVGQALNGGIAIVVMAVALDRVTTAWSQRSRKRTRPLRVAGREIGRRAQILLAVAVTIAAVVICRQVLVQQAFPEDWTTSVAAPANAIVRWSQANLTGIAKAINKALLIWVLNPLRDLLQGVPWWMVAGGAGLLGWRLKGLRLGFAAFACFAAIGVMGTWDISMDTLSQVIVAVVLSLLLAIPIGVLAAWSPGFERGLKPLLDAMQTMPAFVYLVPVLLLFAPGRTAAVIASVVYALPVGIRLTTHGINGVPKETIEAGEAYGSTRGQLLRKVQFPLARPSILLAVNQTIMMVLSVVIIAGLIGGGALGFVIYDALTNSEIGTGLVGGLSILFIAIALDRLTQAMGSAPRAMRGPVGEMGMGMWTKMRAMVVQTGKDGNGKGDG